MYQSVCIVVQCVVHIHICTYTLRVCACVCSVHTHAAGMSKQVAIERYLEKVCVECGVNSYRGYFEDKHVSVNVGCRHIHIIDSNQSTIHKLVLLISTTLSVRHTNIMSVSYHLLNDN